MKLKLHNRARSRLALAGLLAVIAGSTFAQTDSAKPGTVASAQAKSKSSADNPTSKAPVGKPAAEKSAKPGAKAPAPEAPATPAAPMQADGRLKPLIIRPVDPNADPAKAPGMTMPGMMGQQTPGMQGGSSSRQMQQHQRDNPGMGMQSPAQAAPSGPRNPFAPASQPSAPVQPPATSMQPTAPMSGTGAAPAKSANGKKGELKGPSINLDCTTPEIKNQGVFVGKIQNRYVYKYKSQYCFDIEP
jgi:hypothetical protein